MPLLGTIGSVAALVPIFYLYGKTCKIKCSMMLKLAKRGGCTSHGNWSMHVEVTWDNTTCTTCPPDHIVSIMALETVCGREKLQIPALDVDHHHEPKSCHETCDRRAPWLQGFPPSLLQRHRRHHTPKFLPICSFSDMHIYKSIKTLRFFP